MTYSGLLSLLLVDLSLMYDCLSIRTNLFTSGLTTCDVDCSLGSDALGRSGLVMSILLGFVLSIVAEPIQSALPLGFFWSGLRRTSINLHHHLIGCS